MEGARTWGNGIGNFATANTPPLPLGGVRWQTLRQTGNRRVVIGWFGLTMCWGEFEAWGDAAGVVGSGWEAQFVE